MHWGQQQQPGGVELLTQCLDGMSDPHVTVLLCHSWLAMQVWFVIHVRWLCSYMTKHVQRMVLSLKYGA